MKTDNDSRSPEELRAAYPRMSFYGDGKSPSSSQHTSGPWHFMPEKPFVTAYCNETQKQEIVATVYSHSGEVLEWEANARLIAAAPCLLQVLEEINAMQITVPGYNSPSALLLRLAHMQSLARCGIEKAKGGAA